MQGDETGPRPGTATNRRDADALRKRSKRRRLPRQRPAMRMPLLRLSAEGGPLARRVRRTCWSRPMTREDTPLLSRPLNRLRGREEGRGLPKASRSVGAMRQAGWHGAGVAGSRPVRRKAAAGIQPKGRCHEAGSPRMRREQPALAESCRAQARLAGRGGAGILPVPGQCLAEAGIPLSGPGTRAASAPSSSQGCVDPPCPAGIIREPRKIPYFGRKLYHGGLSMSPRPFRDHMKPQRSAHESLFRLSPPAG